jgi:hypothetical protein
MRALGLIAAFTLLGCTENVRAKAYGGTVKVDLEPGTTLVTATWKEAGLWVLTRPRAAGESPTVYTFKEKAQYGLMEGTVIFREQ